MADFFLVLYWGLVDGGNMCQLASSGLMALVSFLFCRDRKSFFSIIVSFVLVYVVAMFFLHTGFLYSFAGTLAYNMMVIIFYMTTGVLFMVFGGGLFYSWLSVRQGMKEFVLQGFWDLPFFLYRPLGVLLACLAAVNATFWPLGQGAAMDLQTMFIPGFLLRGTVSLLFYEFLRLWPFLGFVAAFVLFQKSEKFRCLVKARYPVLCIIFSAVYIALGGCLVFFFFPQGLYLQ